VKSKDRATSSVAARRAVLKRIKDEKIEHVLFWFTDLEGHLKSFAITPNEMAGALDDGMGFDGSSITGFNAIEESDMVAIPDPLTFQVMPRPLDESGRAVGAKVGRMICDVVKPDGSPYIAVCWHDWHDGYFWLVPRARSRWAEYLDSDVVFGVRASLVTEYVPHAAGTGPHGSELEGPYHTLTFTFTDCNHGTVDFDSVLGYGAGSMNLTRLTQPASLSCP
jgi:hypothetical protein